MAILVLLGAMALSAALGVAGVAKLRDQSGIRATLGALGIRGRAAPVLALAVPMVEIALATALLPTASRRLAAVAAAAVLGGFTVVLGAALARGRPVRCGCFGAMSTKDVTWSTLTRNGALVSLALMVATRPTGWDEAGQAAGGGTVVLVLVLAVAALAAVLAVTLRFHLELTSRYGEILLRLAELEGGTAPSHRPGVLTALRAGSPVPSLTLREHDGGQVALSSVWTGSSAAVLVFSEPTCSTCKELEPVLAEWAAANPDVALAVISPYAARRSRLDHHGEPVRWLVDEEQASFRTFGAVRTPTAVMVDGDGRLAAEPAVGPVEVRGLLRVAGARSLGLGEVEMPGSDGRKARVRDVVGADGALLFWDPGCRFCDDLFPQLQALVPAGRTGPPSHLVVVVSGRPDAGLVPALGCPALFDVDGLAKAVAGVSGTPSLVTLIDGHAGPAVAGVGAVRDETARFLRREAGGPEPIATTGVRA